MCLKQNRPVTYEWKGIKESKRLVNEQQTKPSDDERVRDHLANERTYLAWLRTGIATMGLGVVISKMRYYGGSALAKDVELAQASNLGLLFAFCGIITIVLAVVFFLNTRSQIRDRTYRPRIELPVTLTVLISVLGLLILWYLSQPLFAIK
jgi:putative membrane protein